MVHFGKFQGLLVALLASGPPGSALSAPAEPKAPAAAPKTRAPAEPAKPGTPKGAAPAKPAPPPRPEPAAGLVVIERGGRVLGIGTILDGDGRILTALSTLADARPVELKFADGTTTSARLGHADRGKDLALLIPQNARHKQGLKAGRGAALAGGATLRAYAGSAAGKAVARPNVTIKGPGDYRGADGKPLPEALELGTPLDPKSAGTPLINDAGEVVAVVARACRSATSRGCSEVAAALPVTEVREFLQKTPPSAALPAPSIGITGVFEDTGGVRGVRVTALAPGSPAAIAGIKAGKDAASSDTVVALDGVPVTTPEALAKAVGARSVGDVLDLLVFGDGRFRHVTLVVVAAPR